MEEWLEILYFIGALCIAWILYSYIKNKPNSFSSANIIKSLHTLGILAIILIVFIWFCIWSLQKS
jgi:hypothetical protein